jgi:5'-nucleotidase
MRANPNPARRAGRAAAAIAALLLLAVALPPIAGAARSTKLVDIQILGLNDFHGQLQVVPPTASSAGRIGFLTDIDPDPNVTVNRCLEGCIPAGGVEYLATHVRELRADNPRRTMFVSAGDLIGATPLLSALFHDEPTIEAFNLMDLDLNGVGNHEFDEGVPELLRVAYGKHEADGYTPARADGCHPVDGCGDGDPYRGADFPFLAANVVYKSSGDTIFPPYRVKTFGGVKVAFIGMTLEGTPEIVSPDGISMVNFLDEAATVNALVPVLQEQGVEAFVVLLHEGGTTSTSGNGAGGDPALISSCVNPGGAIPPIAAAMDDAIDIMITGHTNWAVNCLIDGKLVTGAAAQGRLITDIDARLNKATKDFVKPIAVNNHIVTQDVPKAPDLTALIDEYNVVAGPIAAVPVGATTEALTRATNAAGESQLGRLIADAQLAHPSVAGAQIALMNPGGIRSDLDAGVITHGEAFGVQPFSNILMVRSFTGAEIEAILEQQFVNPNGSARTLILAVSNGFTYTWDGAAGAVGNRIDPATITLNGQPLDPAGTYKVAMNNFLGFGGDSFPAMFAGDVVNFGADDLVALEAFLGANNPYNPASAGGTRITRVN